MLAILLVDPENICHLKNSYKLLHSDWSVYITACILIGRSGKHLPSEKQLEAAVVCLVRLNDMLAFLVVGLANICHLKSSWKLL